jgi:hypothetical protein
MTEPGNVEEFPSSNKVLEPVPVSSDNEPQLVMEKVQLPNPEDDEEKNPFKDPHLAVFCAVIALDKPGLLDWFAARFGALVLNNNFTLDVMQRVIESFRAMPPNSLEMLKFMVKKGAVNRQRVLASARQSNTYETALSVGLLTTTTAAEDALHSNVQLEALKKALCEHDRRMIEYANSLTLAQLKMAIVFFCEIGLDVGIGSFIAVANRDLHKMTQAEIRAYIDMPNDTFKPGDPIEQIIKEVTAWAEPLKPKIEGTEIITVASDGTVTEKLVVDGDLLDVSEFEEVPEVDQQQSSTTTNEEE